MFNFTMDEFADSAKYSKNASKRNESGRGSVITCRVRTESREYLRYYAKKYSTTSSTYLDMILNKIASQDPEFQHYLGNDEVVAVPVDMPEYDEDGVEIVDQEDMM